MGKRKNKHLIPNPKNIVAAKTKQNKEKKGKNDKDDFELPADMNAFESEINILKEQALAAHNEEVKLAKGAYNSIIDSINQSDIVIQVLDARDPHSCRLLEIEKLAKEKGKPLISLINKVDLIPKDVALRWLGDQSFQIDEISQLTAEEPNLPSNDRKDVVVIATSTKDENEQKKAENILFDVINSLSAKLQKKPIISIVGINKVGKSTICSILKSNENISNVIDAPSYLFIASTDTAAILGAIDYRGYTSDLCSLFIERSQDDSIFDSLGIEPTDDPDDVINQYAKVLHKSPKQAGNEIVEKLLNGAQSFFSIPNDTPLKEMNELQKIILDSLPSVDDLDSIHINRGLPLEIDYNLINE